MSRSLLLSAAAILGLSAVAYADDVPENAAALDFVAETQERMKTTFHNLAITDYRPSPIPGLFQADVGGRIIYYYPGHSTEDGDEDVEEMLIFGQIFDAAGNDLTSQAVQERQQLKLSQVDLDQALIIGPEGAPEVVEFSNPSCPYCRVLNNFFNVEAESGRPVRRKIVLTAYTEVDLNKSEHIFCAEDPARALDEIYGGAVSELNTCPDGREKAEAHALMSRTVGITGTPTLWLDGRPVEGFRQGEIVAFLKSKRSK